MLGTGLTKAKIMAMVAALGIVGQAEDASVPLTADGLPQFRDLMEKAMQADLYNRSLFRQQPPPQPRRSNSPSGVHYPRHFTNSATYFAHTSGCGPRESLRRRSGGFARVCRDAAALQSFLNA